MNFFRQTSAVLLCIALSVGPASADFFKEVTKPLKKAGKELERATDRLKREGERLINDVREEARRAEAKLKKIEVEVRRIRDDIYNVIDEIPVVGEKIVELIDEVEDIAEDSVRQVTETTKLIEQADEIMAGNLDEVNISMVSVGSVLGSKIAKNISADKLEAFLQTELVGDLKIIHVVMPLQAIKEELDPTGMSACLRRDATVQALNGEAFLSGAPEFSVPEDSDFSVSLEDAAKKIALGCLRKTVMRSDEEQAELEADNVSAEVQARRNAAEKERDNIMAEIEQSNALKAKEQEYLGGLQREYQTQASNLKRLEALKDSANKLKDQLEEKNEEMREFIASLDPKVAEIVNEVN